MKMNRVLLVMIMTAMMQVVAAQEVVKIGDLAGEAGMVEVNRVQLYYETYGEGSPLLILHGNGGSVQGKHGIIPDLADSYKVVALDSRCHGRSSCPEVDLNYTDMAEDVNAFLEKMDLKEVTIWGHSDGGIIGLMLGYKHPERIKKMLISGANLRKSGLEPELMAFVDRYAEIPDPKLMKQVKLMAQQEQIEIADIKKINVPVTLLVGDRDAVLLEHTVDIFKALPSANLAVLPATTHFMQHNQTDIVNLLKGMKEPFKAPSTVDIARYMASQLFGDGGN